ncbi:MAG: DNA double-strand break repair nuclease NurA [archaeon]|nr:DNA double-strand break repair nuclease NurA [archaeon]
MMNINNTINEAVSRIKTIESSRKFHATKLEQLRNIDLSKFNSPDLLEKQFIQKISPIELNERIAGVDSGFLGKRLHALDIVLVKAVAAIFDYKQNKLDDCSYFPASFSFPTPFISSNALENDEFECNKSLLRLKQEVSTAIETIKNFKPKYLFLDGSIVPQYADKPRKDSKISSNYSEMIALFQQLYKTAEQNSCTLIGAVEDSRGSRIRTILQETILQKNRLLEPAQLENYFDSNLLSYLLKKNERSFAFSYSNNIEKHPVLMDFDEKFSKAIHAMYIRPSELDRPLRIEFLCSENISSKANEIASLVLSLSSFHREYAYPIVLIEADLRARLNVQEVSLLFDKIVDKLGRETAYLAMRRDSRPF